MRKIGFTIVDEYKHLEDVLMPVRSTEGSAGYDVKSAEDITLLPYKELIERGESPVYFIKTGLAVEMNEPNMHASLKSRSGFSNRNAIIIPSSEGLIDADFYPNPITLVFINLSDKPVDIKVGDRVAQIVFQKHYLIDDDKPLTQVRKGGFGSTGIE